MESFKSYLEQEEFVEFVLNEFAQPQQQQGTKPWSAKKPEIMQMWQNLRMDMPIYMSPISNQGGDRATYGEDGIRITGSYPFISAVLGRLKDMLNYENPHTKLRLVFRGVDKAKDARPDRQSFVFYVNSETRGKGKPGRPKQIKLEPPKI